MIPSLLKELAECGTIYLTSNGKKWVLVVKDKNENTIAHMTATSLYDVVNRAYLTVNTELKVNK